jgi:site-specific DNA-methyltransferase (adenine-specific)
LSNVQIIHGDCMQAMASMKDKEFELAIVDVPFGINADSNAYKNGQMCKANGFKEHRNGQWDTSAPDKIYFRELLRVSENQIIWGANHFISKILRDSSCWLVWNKVQRGFSFADAELAWTSFPTAVRCFDYARGNDSGFAPKLRGLARIGINIHPTQKPVALYQWLLKNYAKPGDRILDTHLGSGSSAIAADIMGYDFVGYEIDKDYYKAALDRFTRHKQQTVLEF